MNITRYKPGSPDCQDLFCGAGGSTAGVERRGVRVRYAVNHSPIAVASHSANFPETAHDCADISQTNPRRYNRTSLLIASPECDYHTTASGLKREAQPDLFGDVDFNAKAERSRATAWDVVRFAEVHRYDAIIVENVTEFHDWRLFPIWLNALRALDYESETVYMNAMFAHLDPATVSQLGQFVPQSRDRMFVVLWKKGLRRPNLNFTPQAFCPTCATQVASVQSWKKENRRWGKWGPRGQYLYRCPHCAGVVTPSFFAAANIIDWTIAMQRIGDRSKPLKDKTISRIQAGIDRFWSGSEHTPAGLIIPTNHDARQARTIADFLPTTTTHQGLGVVVPSIVTMRGTDGDAPNARGYYRVQPITDALPAQVATATQQWILGMPFLAMLRNHQTTASIDEPLHTITAGGVHHGLVVTYNGHSVSSGIDQALPAVTTIARHGFVIMNEKPPIEDCLFRMLTPEECKLSQSFPPEYIIKGTKRQQVEQIGNANPPALMSMIIDPVTEILQ